MPDTSDMELLQDYNRHGSEEAFAELVRRQVNLVYSAALRRAGNATHAEEITQAVFLILARKAAGLRLDTTLEGWLYETTRLVSLSFLRGERRRQFREQEAYMRSAPDESRDVSVWNQMAPLLDEAMSRLGKADRDAVILRFFKDKSLGEVAAALNVTEAAAQSRVRRALTKLHRHFTKRGVSSTTTVIAGALTANSVHAAPAALANSVTAAVITQGATAGSSTLTVVKGALKLMAWTKAKTTIFVAVGVLLAAGTTSVIVQEIREYHVDESWRTLNINPVLLDQTAQQVKILPTKFAQIDGNGGTGARSGDKWAGIGARVSDLVWVAYGGTNLSRSRILFATPEPRARYDFIASLPRGSARALQAELKRKLGLTGKFEMRQTDVLLLSAKQPNMSGLRPGTNGRANYEWNPGHYAAVNTPVHDMAAAFLESYYGIPVIDQTGFGEQCFDVNLKWVESGPGRLSPDGLKQAMLEQLGLELTPTNMPVEMLVVEKSD